MVKNNSLANIFLCCVVAVLFSSKFCAAGDDLEQAKNRRGGTISLFPFPRVGRSDPSLSNWEVVPNSYEEYDDIPKYEMKHSGLIPFPSVGRSDNNFLYRKWSKLASNYQNNMEKRAGTSSANSGLWFGPRLGRIQKRSIDSNDSTNNNDHLN